jgi:eukaryotic-like serine/threonine-protein kinase
MYVAEFDLGAKQLSTPGRLASSDDLSYPIAWTSVGNELFIESNRDGSWGIYRQQLVGGDAKPVLTGLPDLPFNPVVSPDQKWLLYPKESTSGPSGTLTLIRVPIDGGPPKEAFPIRFGVLKCGQLSGSSCVIAQRPPDSDVLVFVRADPVTGLGTELARLKDPHASDLAWVLAPDASTIALFAQFDDSIRILSLHDHSLRELKTSKPTHLRTLNWAADGRGFFASSATQDSARLVYIDLRGNVNPLWEVKGVNPFLRAKPSPDGRKLAIQTITQNANLWMIENF